MHRRTVARTPHTLPYLREPCRGDPVRGERGAAQLDALRRSEAHWHAVFEHNPTMYFIVDADGIIAAVNPVGARQLGYFVGELVGRPVLEVFYQPDREFVGNSVADCLAHPQRTRSWEVRKIRKDGSVLWVRETVKAMRNGGGRTVVLVVCEDITDRKRTEQALCRARADLEQRVAERTSELQHSIRRLASEVAERERAEAVLAQRSNELARSNAELEQLAYAASHDLQEPLRMVAGYMQLLEDKYHGRLDADADEFIHFAVDGVIRMQALIDDLLAYSRVGSHMKPLQRTDCGAVVATALRSLGMALDESGAQMQCEELPVVMGDPAQLAQVFQNLIANAIKFRGDDPPHIYIGAEREGAFWRFTVQDNGIGIEAEYFDRIFVMFQRLHGRRTYPGTGIGLAICKKIVERHGGQIWVESAPQQGATFFFTLPGEGQD